MNKSANEFKFAILVFWVFFKYICALLHFLTLWSTHRALIMACVVSTSCLFSENYFY